MTGAGRAVQPDRVRGRSCIELHQRLRSGSAAHRDGEDQQWDRAEHRHPPCHGGPGRPAAMQPAITASGANGRCLDDDRAARTAPAGPTLKDLHGNTLGLKPSELRLLRNTYRRRVSPHEIVSPELARHLTGLSHETNRQVGVLLNRKGEVEEVVVGNAHKLDLPDIGRARAGQVRLRGLRLVHTHLKSEPLTRDDLTDLALLRLDLVAAIGVGPDGLPGVLHFAHLIPANGAGDYWRTETLPSVHGDQPDLAATLQALESELAEHTPTRSISSAGRAVLVAVALHQDRATTEASLRELAELARTAGVEVVDSVLQGRKEADPRYLVGRGKLEELNLKSMQLGADLLVFDRDLSPSQARHIAEETSLKVLDRTQLILDIFAQRAQSADGKLQVELAQLKYVLPRLAQSDDSLSRLAGGIGGPRTGRDQAGDRPAAGARSHHASGEANRPALLRPPGPPGPPRATRPPGHLHRRLHQRRKVHPPQRAHREPGAGRGQAVRHPRPHQPPAAFPGGARGHHHRHGGLHPRPAQGPGRRLSRHAGGAGRRLAPPPRGGRLRPGARRAGRGGGADPRGRSGWTRRRGSWSGTRPTGCPPSCSPRWCERVAASR